LGRTAYCISNVPRSIMASLARPYQLPALLVIGLLFFLISDGRSAGAKQKRRPPAPAANVLPPPPPTSKSSLTGENVKLTWDDFTRLESPPDAQRVGVGKSAHHRRRL